MVNTVSQLPGVPPAARRACLLPALTSGPPTAAAAAAGTTTGLAPPAQRQLLQLLCEQAESATGQLLASFPDLLCDLFGASDANIRGWFSHFSMAGAPAGQGRRWLPERRRMHAWHASGATWHGARVAGAGGKHPGGGSMACR